MAIHRRQFIIGPKPLLINGTWSSIKLSPSLYLSHCIDLPVSATRDRDNVLWCILGLAVQTNPQRLDPLEEVSFSHTCEIKELYRTWSGRWVIVGNDELHMDASGLLGCFYRIVDNGFNKSKELWISSSAALLSDLPDYRPLEKIGDIRLLQGGINWYPPPISVIRSINKLLPSQILCLSKGRLISRRLISEDEECTDYSEILDSLQNRLVSAIRRAAEQYENVWVPLSAGYDSRLLLALALCTGFSVKTYTMEKKDHRRMSTRNELMTSPFLIADMIMPPEIAKAVGVEHTWIRKGEYSENALELFGKHTSEHTIENDRVYFTHKQWEWTKNRDLILRGGVFEVGKCFYWKTFPDKLSPGVLPHVDEVLEKFSVSKDSLQGSGLCKWFDWVTQSPQEKIDWRDRLYIEQRLAGWLSSLEQGLDLVEGENYYVVNSSSIFKMLLSIPEEKRLQNQHHIDLIKRIEPKLMRFPFNTPNQVPLHLRIKLRIKKKLKRILFHV